MKYAIVILAAMVMVMIAAPAVADNDLSPVGDAFESGSWSQAFKIENFDTHKHWKRINGSWVRVETTSPQIFLGIVFDLTGDTFEAPGVTNMNPSGWDEYTPLTTPTHIIYTTPFWAPTDTMLFTTNFVGDMGDPLTLGVSLWSHFLGLWYPVGGGVAQWDGSSWAITNYGPDNLSDLNGANCAVVPVPGAMLLGAMGLGMIGWLKKHAKKAEERA